jgi:hypothetical protein
VAVPDVIWAPPARPAWVASINRGEVPPIADEACAPLERDALVAEARARMGLADGGVDDFGDARFFEPLDLFLSAAEAEADLNLIGRWMTRRFLVRLLCGRLQLLAYTAADPAVLTERIVEPLVVTGAPRTGTTILHALLAEDPAHRAPLGWELLYPVPPPEPANVAADARIALADRELRLLAQVSADLDSIHEYSGRMTKECLSAMSFTFRSEEFTSRYRVPTYADWLARCDMRPAYESHRLVLQILQRRWSQQRWTLKSPVHLHALPTLLSVYPDARIVITHRDPLTVLGSLTSLIATLRWAHSDTVDYAEIGRAHARMYHADLDRLVDACEDGTLDPSRVHHVRYADFMASPLGTVREIYHAAGWELTATAAERIGAHLERRPRGMHGPHVYAFDDLGLDRDAERARFARYQDAFGVPDEA